MRAARRFARLLVLLALPVRAQEPTAPPAPSEKPWYETIAVAGLVSATYTENFNHPDSSTNQLRVFDTEAGSFRLDVAELVLSRKAGAPGETGFRVDAFAGASIPHVTAASGLFRDETGKAGDFDLFQAYVTWVAPVGSGLKVEAGKFADFMGYEMTEGPDGINDNASRSLLFGWALPATFTGLRASYAFGETLSAQLHLVNGWDVVKDDNSAKSVGAQVAFAPVPALTLALGAMTGAEKPDNDRDRRTILDLVATWKAAERLSFALAADHGTEERSRPDGASAVWSGVAAYARFQAHPKLAFALRAEFFDDPDGVRTGTPQTAREVTFTPEWRPGKGFVIRGDLRHDWSDVPVFEKEGEYAKGQTTASLNLLCVF